MVSVVSQGRRTDHVTNNPIYEFWGPHAIIVMVEAKHFKFCMQMKHERYQLTYDKRALPPTKFRCVVVVLDLYF